MATRVANNLSARGVCAMIGGVPRLSTPMPELPEAWELGESLGIGSFGSVWRVSHRETAEQGAVKVLPRPEENTHKLMRITTEIATMERSCRGCPFILQLREVHTMERHILIVMELAAGGELLDYLARTDRNEALVRSFFQQLVILSFASPAAVALGSSAPLNGLDALATALYLALVGAEALAVTEPARDAAGEASSRRKKRHTRRWWERYAARRGGETTETSWRVFALRGAASACVVVRLTALAVGAVLKRADGRGEDERRSLL